MFLPQYEVYSLTNLIFPNVGTVKPMLQKTAKPFLFPSPLFEHLQETKIHNVEEGSCIRVTKYHRKFYTSCPEPREGEPTKLHKRKHQIGSVYFEMRSKEMELEETRSESFLTKAKVFDT